MRRENRDINLVEQTNIPTFSKQNNIGTSLRPFESFFEYASVVIIVG